jgi:anti-sigma factor RsiW
MSKYITCRELIDQLDAYVDGSMAQDQRAKLDEHFSVCPACRAYLANYRTTISLGRAVFSDVDARVPADVPRELMEAILASRKKR